MSPEVVGAPDYTRHHLLAENRENAALIRKAFDDGFGRMRETLAVAQVIVWLALSASLVALGITACYILRLH